jgi:hypothetical protein
VCVFGRPESGGGQRRLCALEGRIIGDIELPVGAQRRIPAICLIAIRKPKEMPNLLAACLVINEPTVFKLSGQAHEGLLLQE